MKAIHLFLLVTISLFGDDRPNVLFIAIDDMNNWVGALRSEMNVKTPHIDQLAAEGVLFTNAHCAVPACNPSRTSLLMGVHPHKSGLYFNQQDWRENKYLKTLPSLPSYFKQQGYVTKGGGKVYHSHSLNEQAFSGFMESDPWDEYFPSKTRQMPVEIKPTTFPLNGNKKFYRGHFDWAELEIQDDEMADGKVVTWAERELMRKHDAPLFLAVGIYRPHVPWYTPKPYFDLYRDDVNMPKVKKNDLDDVPEAGKEMARRHWQAWLEDQNKWEDAVRAYKASMTFTDVMVGRLMNALMLGPMSKNTIVVLWSDHGYHLGHKEHWEKFTLWSQASQVPLIIKCPGSKSTHRCDSPVSLIDIYPTLVDLCGFPYLDHLDGVSLKPCLTQPSSLEQRKILITHGPGNFAVQSKDWRYLSYEDGSEELYHHVKDPHEFNNLTNVPEVKNILEEHKAHVPKELAPLDPFRKL